MYSIIASLNVFSDVSCNVGNHWYYKQLQAYLNLQKGTKEKILFGSDFMINLLYYKSYNDFVNVFRKTKNLDNQIKIKMCNTNARDFLFAPL